MNHTKEPWVLRGNEIGKRIISDDQSHGMMLSIAHVDKYDFADIWEENASRIVACVNACAGIDTDILKRNENKVSVLLTQRDELLAAMERYLPFIPTSTATKTGAARFSENVLAADQYREALEAAKS